VLFLNCRKLTTALVVVIAASATTIPVAHAEGIAGPYLAARVASAEHDFQAAAEYYIRALTRDPANKTLLANTVMALVGKGDVARAITVSRRLKALDDSNQIANTLLLADDVAKGDFDGAAKLLAGKNNGVGPLIEGLAKAWVQVGQGRMSDALATFDAAGKRKGLKSFAAYHKALALALVGDLEAAEKIFSGSEGPNIGSSRRGVMAHAQILSQLERNQDAIALFDAAFGNDLDPGLKALYRDLKDGKTLPLTIVRSARDGLAEVFFGVSSALMSDGNDTTTLLYVRIASFLRPDNEAATLMTAKLLERLGRYGLATEAYSRIKPDSPNYEAAELGRADALIRSGNLDAAIGVLEKLAKAFPDQPAVHEALGNALRRAKRYKEAAVAYNHAIALYPADDPTHWNVYFARGITYERTNQWDKAEADFRKALELQPDQPQVLNYLGYSFVEMNRNLDEALKMIETAVKKRPNDGYITDSLGWVYYRLGRYQDAVREMERAVELLPVDPILNDHLGDVYWAVGRKREAEYQWSRALSFGPDEKDAKRIRRKLEVGLDKVLEEEGAKPLKQAHGG